MHTVTKILVAFGAILSVFLAALTMAYTANADRIRASIQDEVARYEATATSAREDATRNAEVAAQRQLEIESLSQTLAEQRRQVSNLQNERTQLRTELEQMRAQVDSIRSQIGQLGVTVETQAALITSYRDEATALRGEQLAASRREIELVDRLNDLESQREVLEQTARALREQLSEAQLALQNAMSGRGATSASSDVFVPTGPQIRATVQEIVKSPAGEDLAVINIGTNSGVRENMLMTIMRGNGEFVANLVIIQADARQSVGRIDRLGRQVEVRPGDTVFTGGTTR